MTCWCLGRCWVGLSLGPSGWHKWPCCSSTRVFSRSYNWIVWLRPFSKQKRNFRNVDCVLRSFIHAFIYALIQFRSVPFHCIHAFIHALINAIQFRSVPSIHHSTIHCSFNTLFIPSFLHSFIPSFLHSFLHSFIHSFIPWFIPSFIPSFIHSFIHSFILCSFIQSFIYSFIHWAKIFNTHYLIL